VQADADVGAIHLARALGQEMGDLFHRRLLDVGGQVLELFIALVEHVAVGAVDVATLGDLQHDLDFSYIIKFLRHG